jgi:GT2 family glycosyltransferase
MAALPIIDVVIPTYRRPGRAEKLIGPLCLQLKPDDRVYVVWQGKQKPDIRETEQIHLIRSSRPGLPRARNRGIEAGRGTIILFLDDDVEILPDLIDAHRNAYVDPSIGAVAGRLDDPCFTGGDGEPAVFDEKTGNLLQNFCVQKSQYATSLMGANMSFLRDCLAEIGNFDENFLHNGLWEEVDVAFRLRQAGYKIWYSHAAQVRHMRENTGGCRADGTARYLFHEFANTAYFASRHAGRRHWPSWFTFWKYRLEYETRKKTFGLKHDPFLVASGVFGAFAGIARYITKGRDFEIKKGLS